MYKLKNNLEYEIRFAKVEDAEILLEFIDVISSESDNLTFGEGEFNMTLENEIDYLKNLSNNDNQIMLVAVLDGKIISNLGYSGGFRNRTRHCGEFGVAVRKKYWNNGVASNLINELFKWGKDSKFCEKINLKVREDNEKAIMLYESLGFVKEGLLLKDMKINGSFVNCFFMGKSI